MRPRKEEITSSPHVGWLGLEQPRDLELAREAMAFTNVAHLARRPLPQLSGGELPRVSIARAICQQPRLLLLDEPTAALDPAHQVNLMDLMAQLQQERGLTVVMVSHDLNLAAMYGEQLLLLILSCSKLTINKPIETGNGGDQILITFQRY